VRSTIDSDSSSSFTAALVRFGIFEMDSRSGELRRNGVKVKIQELPFKALTLLLSRPHEVLSREEFRQALWPDHVFVDFDHGITTAINRLREALDDSASNPRFIETLERRGYRWIAPIEVFEPTKDLLSLKAESAEPGSAIRKKVRPWRRLEFLVPLSALVLVWALATFWSLHRPVRNLPKANYFSAPDADDAKTSHPAIHGAAEQFYLKGRYYWEKRTPESLNKAVDFFTQSIVHDPGYAPAYVGLADTYNLLREYSVMPASEAYPRALAAAQKAVELDPQSSEAHASLGFVSFFGMWDSAQADREFRRAIELDPKNAVAHHWYATYLASRRRFPESLAEIQRAQGLDPSSKSVLADEGSILFDSGRTQEATVLLKQVEDNDPDFISPHRYLRLIYLDTADYPDYLVEARTEARLMHDSNSLASVAATEKGLAAAGGMGLLKSLRLQQMRLYNHGLVSPYFVAETCSLLGNKDEAIHFLKLAYKQHAENVTGMATDHAFDNLHNEPAFRQLLIDAGLPQLEENANQ
jgi:DNA-binding winged helix-turn-helix (wHTH) protein